MSYVLNLNLLWVLKMLHDVDQWDVSYIEVDTWPGGFDMT
jgi:hypothetical protein